MSFHLRNLFKRDCVSCTNNNLDCESCPSGQVCQLSVQTCDSCPQPRCVDSKSSGSGLNTGAIAGGVVGGVVGLGLIVGCLVWYKFRHHRKNHLQYMQEEKLQYESPPESPTMDPEPLGQHLRQVSIPSTYGENSQRSNIIPIMLPLGGRANSIAGSSRNTAYSHSGIPITFQSGSQPFLRDSIGFSEYSVDSDSASANNRGLRSYDVAVQGMPNLVELNKGRRMPMRQVPLGAISENDVYNEPRNRPASNTSSSPKSRLSGKRRSMMTMKSADAALPELPQSDAESCFDDSQAVRDEDIPAHTVPADQPSRYSQASSNQYDAHLPEEAKAYIDSDLIR